MNDQSLVFEEDAESGDVIYGPPPAPPEQPQTGALIEQLTEQDRDHIVLTLTEAIANDERDSAGRVAARGSFFELLGMSPEAIEQQRTADDDDTSHHPLLLNALLRFTSKGASALLPSDDEMVRYKPAMALDDIEEPDERAQMQELVDDAGRRVVAFYTEYLKERVPHYSSDTDLLLQDMGLLGLGVRKIGRDSSDPYAPVTLDYVPLEDLVFSVNTQNLCSGRFAHRRRLSTAEMVRRVMRGVYRPLRSLGNTPGGLDMSPLEHDRLTAYGLTNMAADEMHGVIDIYTDLFMSGSALEHPEKLARPYVVTVHTGSQQMLSIQPNWRRGDPRERPIEHFVGYIYHPGMSEVVAVGLGDILGSITKALRTAQREAFDAAYLQNHPSGYKLASLSIADEQTPVVKGAFIDVSSPTQDIREAIMPHIFQGVSPGLLQLSDRLEANGKELGGIASIDFANLMKAGIAAGPAMAAFEESTEFQTAVHRRLYTAHAKELKLTHDRMRESFARQAVEFADGQRQLQPDDLMLVDVIPYMKPGQVSRQKSILEAEAIYRMSLEAPDVVLKRRACEDYLRALGKANIDDYIAPDPQEEAPEPADPLTEYEMVLQGMPIVAGPDQNHAAHIDTHAIQMRMLQAAQLPVEQGEAAMAVLAAHIAEHMGLQLKVQVAAMLGVSLEQLLQDPAVAEQLAPDIAQAVAQIESARRPEGDGRNERIEVERIKGQYRQDELRLKADIEMEQKDMQRRHEIEMADLKAAQAREVQKQKDAAAMQREREDNAAALQIAREKAGGAGRSSAAATAGVRSGVGATAGVRAGDR